MGKTNFGEGGLVWGQSLGPKETPRGPLFWASAYGEDVTTDTRNPTRGPRTSVLTVLYATYPVWGRGWDCGAENMTFVGEGVWFDTVD